MKLLSNSQMTLFDNSMEQRGYLLHMDQQSSTYTSLQDYAPSNKQLPTNQHASTLQNHSQVNTSAINHKATSHGYTSLDKSTLREQPIS